MQDCDFDGIQVSFNPNGLYYLPSCAHVRLVCLSFGNQWILRVNARTRDQTRLWAFPYVIQCTRPSGNKTSAFDWKLSWERLNLINRDVGWLALPPATLFFSHRRVLSSYLIIQRSGWFSCVEQNVVKRKTKAHLIFPSWQYWYHAYE